MLPSLSKAIYVEPSDQYRPDMPFKMIVHFSVDGRGTGSPKRPQSNLVTHPYASSVATKYDLPGPVIWSTRNDDSHHRLRHGVRLLRRCAVFRGLRLQSTIQFSAIYPLQIRTFCIALHNPTHWALLSSCSPGQGHT